MPASINKYRNERYRVFYSSSYFNLDLRSEIDWHNDHIKKLLNHKANPSSFYREFTSHSIDEHRLRHFKEHIIEGIPFHEKRRNDHHKRLKTIRDLLPKKRYNKLKRISMKFGGTPKYFIYEKPTKNYFFVADGTEIDLKTWMKKTKKLAKVEILQ